MATISGYDSSSLGVLFSSMSSKDKNTSGFGGISDMLGINYSDYATIRNGSYFKLLDAYYGKNNSNIKDAESSTSTSKDDSKTLMRIEDAVDGLKDSLKSLQTVGKNSLFEKIETKDEDGNPITDYDRDKLYQAAKQFAEDYNNLLDQASESDTVNILRTARSMVNYTKAHERTLASVGIKIGADNKLTVDEKAFKESKLVKLQSLFQGAGSYGYQINAQASRLDTYAKNEASKANTYGKNGSYTYNYNTGELYNTEA